MSAQSIFLSMPVIQQHQLAFSCSVFLTQFSLIQIFLLIFLLFFCLIDLFLTFDIFINSCIASLNMQLRNINFSNIYIQSVKMNLTKHERTKRLHESFKKKERILLKIKTK